MKLGEMNNIKFCPECNSVRIMFIEDKKWKIQGDVCMQCKNVFNVENMEE